MWLTMGPIADREKDVLGASDVAIVEFRRQMAQAAKDFVASKPVIGTGDMRIPLGIHSYQRVISKRTDWRSLGS